MPADTPDTTVPTPTGELAGLTRGEALDWLLTAGFTPDDITRLETALLSAPPTPETPLAMREASE